MSTGSEERWERLVKQVANETDIEMRLDRRSYQEMRYGRPNFGTSYSAFHRLPSGHSIEIRDAWWRKNADVWIGYQVDLVDHEGIVKRYWRPTKKRSEVTAAVEEAAREYTLLRGN